MSDPGLQLRLINSLFSGVTGNDLYLAEQIKAAITTSLQEVQDRPAADPTFIQEATRLFEMLFRDDPQHGFFHWDASENYLAATPLFTRAIIVDGMKKLARFPESTLLITNLRAAHVPAGGRLSAKRRMEYEEALTYIRKLAAQRTRESANLNLFFL